MTQWPRTAWPRNSTSSRFGILPATSSSSPTSWSSLGPGGSCVKDVDQQRPRRSVTCWASPSSIRCFTACPSSGSCRCYARRSLTSMSTSTLDVVRRSSSTSTPSTGGATLPRWLTSSPIGRAVPSGTRPRPSVIPKGSRTRGRVRWRDDQWCRAPGAPRAPRFLTRSSLSPSR